MSDYSWADPDFTWADAVATWGNYSTALIALPAVTASGSGSVKSKVSGISNVVLPAITSTAPGNTTTNVTGSGSVTLPHIALWSIGTSGANNNPPVYRIEARDAAGNFYAQLPYRDLQFEVSLNKPSDFRFKVPLHEGITMQVLEAGKHEAWIYRNDVLVKAGPIWNVTPNSGDGDINCDGTDLLDYFDVLRIPAYARYQAVDQFAIVTDLIATAQAQTDGNYGITTSLGQSGIVINSLYSGTDGKMLLEAIQDIAAEDTGFDFWVDPASRQFCGFYPRLQRDQGLVLEYPSAIRSYSINYFGKWCRNDIMVLGPYNRTATAISTTSRSYRGLRQLTESYTDAPDPTALAARASYLRDLRQYPKVSPTISLTPNYLNIFDASTIRLGDMISVVINDGYVQIDEQLRLIGFQVTVGRQGQESVVLYFNDDREIVGEGN